MVFTSTILDTGDATGQSIVRGKYVSDSGSTGGDIVTGLNRVSNIILTPLGSSVVSAPVLNETIDSDGTMVATVTVVTNADESGFWIATGF